MFILNVIMLYKVIKMLFFNDFFIYFYGFMIYNVYYILCYI